VVGGDRVGPPEWRQPYSDRRPPGCGIGYAESCLAEKDSLWPDGSDTLKWPENGASSKPKSNRAFGQGTETGENVPRASTPGFRQTPCG